MEQIFKKICIHKSLTLKYFFILFCEYMGKYFIADTFLAFFYVIYCCYFELFTVAYRKLHNLFFSKNFMNFVVIGIRRSSYLYWNAQCFNLIILMRESTSNAKGNHNTYLLTLMAIISLKFTLISAHL